MKRLEYVGLKQDGERAFKERTGIEWFPGDTKDVAEDVATEMLRHTDVWREVPGATARKAADAGMALIGADGSALFGTGLPEWAKKGIELGATDEQLEAVAQAGGPETDEGAALWRDATGTDWKPAEPVAPEKKPAAKNAAAKKAKRK